VTGAEASSICGFGELHLILWLDELAPAMQRGLDVPSVVESTSHLLQREVERLLSTTRPLLRREATGVYRGFADRARLAAGCALRIRFGLGEARRVDHRFDAIRKSHRARILGRLIHAPQLRERTEEASERDRRVPRTTGQLPHSIESGRSGS